MTIQKVQMLLEAISSIRSAALSLQFEERGEKAKHTETVCICGARWDRWHPKPLVDTHNPGCLSMELTLKADLVENELSALLHGCPA
jgi:hypothetical protein